MRIDLRNVHLRPEHPDERAKIHALVEEAFRDMPFSDGDEADLVDILRREGALAVSLVAVREDEVIGQIAFSPAFPEDGSAHWYALGPVAVTPSLQRCGLGSMLIRAGLDQIQSVGAVGCILTGNPAFYPRFGFILSPQNSSREDGAEYFMVKVFGGPLPEGIIRFHPAFYPGC